MAAINYSIAQNVQDSYPVLCSEPDFNRFYERIKKLRRTIGITPEDTKKQLDAKKSRLPYIWHAMKDATKGRKATNAGDRDVLFLDLDGCSVDAWIVLKDILKPFSCFVYSTPSHMHPTAQYEQRWRVCFELNRSTSPDEYKRLGTAVEVWLMDCLSLLADYQIKWDRSVYDADHMVYGPDGNAIFEQFRGERVDVDTLLASGPEIPELETKVQRVDPDAGVLSRLVDLNNVDQQTFEDLRSALWHPAVLADAEPACGKYLLWAAMGNRLAWFIDTNFEDQARQLWVDWSIAGGGDGSEAIHKWDEGKLTADRTGYQAIFTRAQKEGWVNPGAERMRASASSLDDFEVLPLEEAEKPRSFPHTGGYGKPGKFIVEGLVPSGVSAWYGASSSFKSYGVISLLCRIAMKTKRWGGRNLKGGAALYVAAEGGSSVMPRVGAWADKYNEGKSIELFYTLPLAVDLSVPARVNAIVKEIKRIEHATGEPVRIVAIDTLSQSMLQGEENSASDIAKFMAGATRVCNETGAAVLIVHHSGKDSSKGMRGSSAVFANADAVVRIERIGDSVNLINEKQRTGPAQPTRGYMVPTVVLPESVIAENEEFDEEYTSTEGEVYDPVRLTTERVFEDIPLAEISAAFDDVEYKKLTPIQTAILTLVESKEGGIERAELRKLWNDHELVSSGEYQKSSLNPTLSRLRDDGYLVDIGGGKITTPSCATTFEDLSI